MQRYASRQRTLVTGGTDFLGSYLCERLLGEGHNLLGVDNFFIEIKDNVANLLVNPQFELMRHDMTFPRDVEVDQTYSLACPTSPANYRGDSSQPTKTSVYGAINMLGLAKKLTSKSCRLPPVKYMETVGYTLSQKDIGERLFRLEFDLAMTNVNSVLKLFFDYRRQHNRDIKVALF